MEKKFPNDFGFDSNTVQDESTSSCEIKSPFSLNIGNFLGLYNYFNFTINTTRHSNRPLKTTGEFNVDGGTCNV